MRRAAACFLLTAILLAGLACQAPPGPEDALREFVRFDEIRKDIDCENPEVVAEYVKARGVRCFGIKATCGRRDNPVARTEYFKVTYAVFGGVWELPEITPVSLGEIEDLNAREPVAFDRPQLSEASDEALFPILIIVIPIAAGAVLFIVGVWVLRPRKKHEVRRPVGAGIKVAHGEKKPGQTRSHWTINPLD
jgi:hypothetical protein